MAAGNVSNHGLQWTFVGYLAVLDLLLLFRPPVSAASGDAESTDPHWAALLAVGAVAGFSSGFMGIGGGLAITAGLSAALKVPQHQAQLVSLALSVIPLTTPAAWIYWRQGWTMPWLVIGGVVVGLWIGTDLGARLANRFPARALRRILIGMVSAMAIYMAYKALH